MNKSCVTPADVRQGGITKGIRKLYAPDSPLQVCVPGDGPPCLYVTRYGNTETLPISRRVAEELIAAGFSYGN